MEREEFRKRFIQRVSEKWDEIIDAKIELATGIAIIDKKDDTGERIFDIPPNPQASKDLTDQVMGRASEHLDVTSGGDKIFALPSELMNKNGISSDTKDRSE